MALAALLAGGCGKAGGGGASTIDPTVQVSSTFSSISKNILTPGCTGCHGGAGGYSFDSYSSTMAAVVAGSPNTSPLYTAISSGRMPQSGTAPSSQQIQAVQAWIAAGAPNN